MKYRHTIAGLITALLALSACAKNDGGVAAKDAVATVNGRAISQTAFDAYVEAVTRQPATELNDEQRTQLLDQFISMQVAADTAEKAGLAKEPKVEAELAITRTNVLTDALLKKYLDEHPITDEDIKKEYDTQVAAMPREYHARHILVENQAIAESVIRELKGGAEFEKLAKEESKDESGKNGGDLGWFTSSTMVKPFADAVEALEKGKITEQPVQSQFGWHVIKLEDSRTPEAPAFDEVKDRVQQIVQRKKLQGYLEELRKGAKIEKTEVKAETTEDKG